MAIKIGDKVRFLNTTGGGIVRGFNGKDKVLVEDEDGFEIPAWIRRCIARISRKQMRRRWKSKSLVPASNRTKRRR